VLQHNLVGHLNLVPVNAHLEVAGPAAGQVGAEHDASDAKQSQQKSADQLPVYYGGPSGTYRRVSLSEELMGYFPRTLVFLSIAALALAGCALSPTRRVQADAGKLFGVLRANEQVYQQALLLEAETLGKLRDSLASGDVVVHERELAAIKLRFERLYERLDSLDLHATVRHEVLSPILRQLRREREELDEISSLLASREPEAARTRLEHHQYPLNLFTPAIQKIRESYGVPRQRLWRGHALTA
jgi:hypothetical protein